MPTRRSVLLACSIVAGLVLLVMAVLSLWTIDQSCRIVDGPENWRAGVRMYRGWMEFFVEHVPEARFYGHHSGWETSVTADVRINALNLSARRRRDLLGVWHYRGGTLPPDIRFRTVDLPAGLVALPWFVPPGLLWRELRKRRRLLKTRRCPECGYDLRESMTNCNECGWTIPHELRFRLAVRSQARAAERSRTGH